MSASTGTIILLGIVIILLFLYYSRAIRPYRLIANGMDLLKGQDFSSRLKKTGQKNADEIVDLFNSLMTQLKEERLRLREQNEFLDLLIKASPLGVVVLDFDNHITQINPSGKALLLPNPEFEFEGLHLDDFSKVSTLNLSEVPIRGTLTFNRTDGSIYKCTHSYFVDRGFKRSFYLIEHLTEEVRRAEKSAYEQVIRMLAHEVNNSTAGITSILDTASKELEDEGDVELSDALSICMERCFSMSDFVSRFAEVVKLPKAVLKGSDLNKMILNQVALIESLGSEKSIKFKMDLDENLSELMLDVPLMEQVFINIVKNAIESISTPEGGEVFIRTSEEEGLLEIRDNGEGIPIEVEGSLFNPFFSTKPQGQGIGLLFTQEVLKQHHFRYSLHTDRESHLTYFRIYFR